VTLLAASPLAVALGALGLAFAAFLKGAVGVGFPVVAAPIIASLVDPQTTIIAVSVPGLLMNLMQLRGEDALRVIVARHARFLAAAAVSTALGAYLVASLDPNLVRLGLGLVVLVWLGLQYVKVPIVLTPSRERWAAPLLGAANGFVGGVTTVFFPILAIYLLGLGLDRRRFVQSISLLFALQQVVQLGALVAAGGVSGTRLGQGLLIAAPVLVGFPLGLRAQGRLDHARFLAIVRVILLAAALQLVYRGARPLLAG
jgi:uncharacterized membrane protein YfcA